MGWFILFLAGLLQFGSAVETTIALWNRPVIAALAKASRDYERCLL
jgi:hypothetical protein